MPPTPGPLITVIRTPRPSQHCRKHHWHFNGHFLLLFLNNACVACQHCFPPPLVCLCSIPLCRNYNGDLCLLCCLLHKLHSSHTWGRQCAVHHTPGDTCVCVWAHMHECFCLWRPLIGTELIKSVFERVNCVPRLSGSGHDFLCVATSVMYVLSVEPMLFFFFYLRKTS